MPTYVILVSYTDDGIRTIKDSPKRLALVKKLIKDMRGKLRSFYLTLGGYDFVAIVEAPSDEAMAQALLVIGAQGMIRTHTLRAFTEAEYREIVKKIPTF